MFIIGAVQHKGCIIALDYRTSAVKSSRENSKHTNYMPLSVNPCTQWANLNLNMLMFKVQNLSRHLSNSSVIQDHHAFKGKNLKSEYQYNPFEASLKLDCYP